MKKLVAYFSATGVTARAANTLAEAIGADVFEIQPEVCYTAKDLDWRDPTSRSTAEMQNPQARPRVAGRLETMGEYERVYVGFPIWWYTAPRIINTFLESYDFRGRTVIPFATSGGSGTEKVGESLASSCLGAVLREARLLPRSAGLQELSHWAEV